MLGYNIADIFENNEWLKPINGLIQYIMDYPEHNLNDTQIEAMMGMINGAITPTVRQQTVSEIINSFEIQGFARVHAQEIVKDFKNEFNSFIDSFQPTETKRKLLNSILNGLYTIFDDAIEQYHNYNIELPIQLDEGAQVPTYAHAGDAAADLYAPETVIVPAHSIGNMIQTGVHIELPEGWVAFILPRSSIGAKTPLRLSNSMGVIDSSYRGGLGVLYDNISDSDYTINAGDRIAQLIVMPSYRFKPQVVESLNDTDRGENGFGSSGK